ACSTPAPPPPPPPPPAPPAPAGFALSTAVVQDAAVYRDYMTRAAAINPAFTSGADVAQSLSQGESISPGQLLRGEVAFAAIAALQDPNFVANVRAFAADPAVREQMASTLVSNPGYAVAFKGSDTAAGLAASAIIAQGRRLYDDGRSVKQAAYDVQAQSWSKSAVEDRSQRLANAKNVSVINAAAAMDEVANLHAAAIGQSQMPLHAPAATPPYSPVIVRGLAVAALAALGEAGDENLVTMAPLFQDAPTATCLNTAKLNLYQCLAVARPHYEDIFCLGQHVMMDTAQCVMIAAGAPAPAFAPPPLPVVTPVSTPKRPKPVRHRRPS
ncbi:MAG: hypothetical protein P4L73_18555, partial [Caulobacteraceae bacterium]|nr:hypothetical protein [Caulobacteraceae bacterium]